MLIMRVDAGMLEESFIGDDLSQEPFRIEQQAKPLAVFLLQE